MENKRATEFLPPEVHPSQVLFRGPLRLQSNAHLLNHNRAYFQLKRYRVVLHNLYLVFYGQVLRQK